MKIQMKLNDRIFAVEVDDNLEDFEEIREEAHEKLIKQIEINNETIHIIFFEELEFVCSECGVSLTNGEEEDATKCLQCENNKVKEDELKDFVDEEDEERYLQLCEDIFALAEDFNRDEHTEEALALKEVFKDCFEKLNEEQQKELQESIDSRGL